MNEKWQDVIGTLDDEIDGNNLNIEDAASMAQKYLADPESCKAWRPASPDRVQAALSSMDESKPRQPKGKSKSKNENDAQFESAQPAQKSTSTNEI
jgi:hypothetical protein